MSDYFNTNFPSIEFLRERARRRMPRFAFEYLEGGCNANVNRRRNTDEIREVQMAPRYIGDYEGPNLKTELFGRTYDAPFGVDPIGLQGMMWPKATEILAAAAHQNNIPFILSTVATASVETVSEITEGNAWFQLYHPADKEMRKNLLKRVEDAGVPVLVILADTPVFAWRPKEIRNGLTLPPRMTLRNIAQMVRHPTWSFSQLAAGVPEFKTIKPYMPKGLDLKQLGNFMSNAFSGRLTEDRIKAIRDLWKGKLVVKGIASEEDCEKVVNLGVDGVIVSNHGGRSFDSGQSTIKALPKIAERFGDKITVMIDGGLREGPDIACALASGAQFTFLGRSFMYGVGALGKRGGLHTVEMLKRQLELVMEHLACSNTKDFPNHLIRS